MAVLAGRYIDVLRDIDVPLGISALIHGSGQVYVSMEP